MSYLADVIIPDKEVDEIEVREVEQEEYVSDEEQGVEEEQDHLPPPPEKKVKLKKEDIFRPKTAPPRKVKVAPEPMEFEEPIIPKIAPVKKKRQLSEKQKEALKKGREARMKKKKQAEALASPAPAPAPAPSFQQETLVRHETATSAPSPAGLAQQYFTQEQVQDMIYSGVQKYDTERKARKVKKRQSQAKQQHENKVFNDINSQLRVNDPWASAFNF